MTTAADPDLVLVCPQCKKAELTFKAGTVECATCGDEMDPEAMAKAYAEEILNENEYEAATNGEVFPVFDCVECGGHTLVRGVKPQPEETGYVHPSDIAPQAWACFGCGAVFLEGEIVYCETGTHVGHAGGGVDICVSCFEAKIADD